MQEHRHALDTRLKEIQASLLGLFTQVKLALEQAASCLANSNTEDCSSIVEHDPDINRHRNQIEEDCLLAIALHQPVAHDLREIVAAMRIAGELERMGDYASDIATIIMQMKDADLTETAGTEVLRMSNLCIGMLDEVLAAYWEKDAAKARMSAKMDDEIDTAQEKLISTLFSTMQSRPDLVPSASRMLWISHNIERCGDRATNIAEQIVFMLEAEVIELD